METLTLEQRIELYEDAQDALVSGTPVKDVTDGGRRIVYMTLSEIQSVLNNLYARRASIGGHTRHFADFSKR